MRFISSSGILIPSDTFVEMTFLPLNLAISTVLSAATMIPSHFSISSGVRIFFAPPEPFVSTLMEIPSRFPAFSSASAAM